MYRTCMQIGEYVQNINGNQMKMYGTCMKIDACVCDMFENAQNMYENEYVYNIDEIQ